MACIGLNSLENQMGLGRNQLGQRQKFLVGGNAAAAHAYVVFYQHLQLAVPGLCHGLFQIQHILCVIHTHRQTAFVGEGCQLGQFFGLYDLVGDDDVGDACRLQIQRLAQLGAGDALGTPLQLDFCNGGALVGFVMGIEGHGGAGQDAVHLLHVAEHGLLVQQQGRGLQIVGLHAITTFFQIYRRTTRPRLLLPAGLPPFLPPLPPTRRP